MSRDECIRATRLAIELKARNAELEATIERIRAMIYFGDRSSADLIEPARAEIAKNIGRIQLAERFISQCHMELGTARRSLKSRKLGPRPGHQI
mgnify:CR=1 FL=1